MRWWWVSLGVLGLSALSAWYLSRPRDISSYAHFSQPQFTHLAPQRVLTITLVGDPDETVKKAASELFGAYFKLQNNAQSVWSPILRARWPLPVNTPRAEWIGQYALPVGDASSLAGAAAGTGGAEKAAADGELHLTTWQYGDYVQILHTGAYKAEVPTVQRLSDFVRAQGKSYEPGSHEEEYLIGPGLFGKGDENAYKTLIRYKLK